MKISYEMTFPKIFFRVDASHEIGSGHVMRCMALANFLRKENLECFFICRELPGNLIQYIRGEGFLVSTLSSTDGAPENCSGYPAHYQWLGVDWLKDAEETSHILRNQKVDWLIVDHYSIDVRWELAVKHSCDHIMVIDDLADRCHACDILLDQNLGRSAIDYSKFLNENSLLLIGPQYALLRDEFQLARNQKKIAAPKNKQKKIMISMGGVDQENITNQVLDELIKIDNIQEFQLTVILGSKSPNIRLVKERILDCPFPVELVIDCREMAKRIREVDLIIGGAGSSSWERCSLGVPSIAIIMAENQIMIARALQRINAAVALSTSEIPSKLSKIVLDLISDPMALKAMSNVAYSVADGLGNSRVYKSMLDLSR